MSSDEFIVDELIATRKQLKESLVENESLKQFLLLFRSRLINKNDSIKFKSIDKNKESELYDVVVNNFLSEV